MHTIKFTLFDTDPKRSAYPYTLDGYMPTSITSLAESRTLDDAKSCAAQLGGLGRIRHGAVVVGYWEQIDGVSYG